MGNSEEKLDYYFKVLSNRITSFTGRGELVRWRYNKTF